jgi:hypothetical protein
MPSILKSFMTIAVVAGIVFANQAANNVIIRDVIIIGSGASGT